MQNATLPKETGASLREGQVLLNYAKKIIVFDDIFCGKPSASCEGILPTSTRLPQD